MPELRMPHISLGDEEVVVVRWHKAVGDVVGQGEPLLEVETDKASLDVEAPWAGTLAAQLCGPGGTVAAGAVIGFLAKPGESYEAEQRPEAGPAAQGKVPGRSSQVPGGGAPASPPVRRAALVEHGELAGMPLDVRPTAAVSAPTPPPDVAAGQYSEVRLSRRRGAIARRLSRAALIPQFAVTRRMSLAHARELVERSRQEGEQATLTDVIVRAVAVAASDVQGVNAWLLEDTLRTFKHVALAIAVETSDGVVAPVIHDAARLQLSAITRLRGDLVDRARSGTLYVHDLEGATITLTNIGPIGGDQLFPVLTPPQTSVVGVGRAETDTAAFTFVGDHRALDGADGARYLVRLEEALTVVEFG